MDDDAPAPPAPSPAPPPAAWYDAPDYAPVKGYVELNGLKDKPPHEAFAEVVKAHQAAQQHLGAPADRRLILPADNTPEAWKPIWQRLGAPETPEGYDFGQVDETVKPTVEAIRAAAAANSVPLPQAKAMAAAVVAQQAAQAKEVADARAAVITQQKEALARSWGQNQAANLDLARAGATRLGVTQTEVDALEQVVGYDKVMEMFRKVGATTGEDAFQGAGAGGGTGPDPALGSAAAATAKLEELKGDKEWLARWNAGGAKETREFQALMKAANPDVYAAAGA